MRAREGLLVVLFLAVIWGGISWWWYACGIKNACGSDANVPTTSLIDRTSA